MAHRREIFISDFSKATWKQAILPNSKKKKSFNLGWVSASANKLGNSLSSVKNQKMTGRFFTMTCLLFDSTKNGLTWSINNSGSAHARYSKQPAKIYSNLNTRPCIHIKLVYRLMNSIRSSSQDKTLLLRTSSIKIRTAVRFSWALPSFWLYPISGGSWFFLGNKYPLCQKRISQAYDLLSLGLSCLPLSCNGETLPSYQSPAAHRYGIYVPCPSNLGLHNAPFTCPP